MRGIPLFLLLVKARVDVVDVLLVQPVLGKPQAFAEAYKMEQMYLPKCAIRSEWNRW